MNPIGLSSSLMAAGGIHASAGQWFGASDARMALGNRVTGNETPAQLAAIQQQDKALELSQAKGKINYEYSTAMQDAADRRRLKNSERRRNLLQMGAIFA